MSTATNHHGTGHAPGARTALQGDAALAEPPLRSTYPFQQRLCPRLDSEVVSRHIARRRGGSIGPVAKLLAELLEEQNSTV